MIPALPPDDRDPLPRSRHEQLAELARMFGDQPPSSTLTRGNGITFGAPTFRPQPGTLDEDRKPGQIFWLWRLPEPTSLDANLLQVCIHHRSVTGSRRPKTRAACAELRSQIVELG